MDAEITYYSTVVKQFTLFDELLKISKALGLQIGVDFDTEVENNQRMIRTRTAILKEFVALRKDLDTLDFNSFAQTFSARMALITSLMSSEPVVH